MLEIKSHEVELLATRRQQSAHSRMVEEVAQAKVQLAESKEALQAALQKESEAEAKSKQIEALMNKSSGMLGLSDASLACSSQALNAGRSQKDEMKIIQEKMASTKSSLSEATKSIKQQEQLIEKAEMEIEELKKERAELSEKIDACEKEIKQLQKELDFLENGKGGVAEKRTAFEAAQQCLQKKQVCAPEQLGYMHVLDLTHNVYMHLQESVLSTDDKIAGLLQEKDDRTQASIEKEQKLKKLQGKIKRFHKDQEDAKKYCVRQTLLPFSYVKLIVSVWL